MNIQFLLQKGVHKDIEDMLEPTETKATGQGPKAAVATCAVTVTSLPAQISPAGLRRQAGKLLLVEVSHTGHGKPCGAKPWPLP